MFDTMSLAEIDRQQVELLPARTVMQASPSGGGAGPLDAILGGGESSGESSGEQQGQSGLPAPLGGLADQLPVDSLLGGL